MPPTLKLVLTDHWFEEIKSGRKTHEYRKVTSFWMNRIFYTEKENYDTCVRSTFQQDSYFLSYLTNGRHVEFQKAYRKNAEKMLFTIKNISIVHGLLTDLKINSWVFDIELGERIR